jgi:hypothetical protein
MAARASSAGRGRGNAGDGARGPVVISATTSDATQPSRKVVRKSDRGDERASGRAGVGVCAWTDAAISVMKSNKVAAFSTFTCTIFPLRRAERSTPPSVDAQAPHRPLGA